MFDRFPGYDVLAKRDGLSWNARTRDVIDARLAAAGPPKFLDAQQRRTLAALSDRIAPQPKGRPPIDVAGMIDGALADDAQDGFRDARMPHARAAWRLGLDGLDADARAANGRAFADLEAAEQDALISAIEAGTATGGHWCHFSAALFFQTRVLPDIVAAYYAHPSAWSAIGFGGPAAPRGYVRMDADRHDPWEAVELTPDSDRDTVIARNRRVG